MSRRAEPGKGCAGPGESRRHDTLGPGRLARHAVTTGHCPGTASVGPYLLHALDPVERESIARHLDRCRVCRDERDALTPVVHLLDVLTGHGWAP